MLLSLIYFEGNGEGRFSYIMVFDVKNNFKKIRWRFDDLKRSPYLIAVLIYIISEWIRNEFLYLRMFISSPIEYFYYPFLIAIWYIVIVKLVRYVQTKFSKNELLTDSHVRESIEKLIINAKRYLVLWLLS